MSRCTCNDPTHFHPGEEAGYWLFPMINVPKTIALNETVPGSVKSLFRPYEQRLNVGPGGPVEGEDGEVILIIPFTETVSKAIVERFHTICPLTMHDLSTFR